MNRMKVYDCGTRVRIPGAGIDGFIRAFEVRGKNVTYQVSYFYQGEHRTCWIEDNEFSAHKGSNKIGFQTKK